MNRTVQKVEQLNSDKSVNEFMVTLSQVTKQLMILEKEYSIAIDQEILRCLEQNQQKIKYLRTKIYQMNKGYYES